jgi:pSer/pThr/pTyr-binding forkhead associated (FHA) protein
MSKTNNHSPLEDGTVLDSNLVIPRLKEGLVPDATGLFLRIQEGAGVGSTFSFSSGGVFLLGREGADLVLQDTKASRKHAEIAMYGPERYFIRDLASTNGTFVNGRRIRERHELHHEDRIRIGDTILQFTVVTDSIPLSC